MGTRHGRILATLAVASLMAGCGGGGGGGSSAPPAANAPKPAGATVVIAPSGDLLHNDYTGAAFTLMARGTVTAANLAAGDLIYLRVRDPRGTLKAPPTQPVAPNQPFQVALGTTSELTPGNYAGQIEYTACRDASCNTPYGPPVTVNYALNLATLGEWETIQRDGTHSGFVPTVIDTTRLNLAWQWRLPPPARVSDQPFITRPATTTGGVHVLGGYTDSNGAQGEQALYSIGEFNGTTRWSYVVPPTAYAQAPTSSWSSGQVFLQLLNYQDLLLSFDGDTGAPRFSVGPGAGIATRTLAPTSLGGLTFYYAGPNGSEVHAISNTNSNTTAGTLRWKRTRTDVQPGTPSVQQGQVFTQDGRTIEILDINTGAPLGSIVDPSSDGATSPFMRSVTALGTRGNLLAVSYSGATGAYPLSSFNIENRRWEWSTTNSYRSFAVSDGVVFAYREGATAPTLDAIDEATGQVQWTWTPPATDAQLRTVGNVMLTRNLVFLSTEAANGTSFVWAIDRASRQVVWRYPGGGYVIMSGSRTIYVLSGPGNGRPSDVLKAFRIK